MCALMGTNANPPTEVMFCFAGPVHWVDAD
jgi:hypothetical protein